MHYLFSRWKSHVVVKCNRRKNMRKKNGRTITIKVLTYIFLILLTLFIIIPLVWMIISGFKSNGDLFTNSFGLPKEWLFSNYILAWNVGIGRYLLNSVFVTFVSGNYRYRDFNKRTCCNQRRKKTAIDHAFCFSHL